MLEDDGMFVVSRVMNEYKFKRYSVSTVSAL
jgi:hypothetical protein